MVQLTPGLKLWKNKNYTLTSLSDGLWGSHLFTACHHINSSKIFATSNKDAEVFVALYREDDADKVISVMDFLISDNWTLKDEWYIEWDNKYRLDKVWSKNLSYNHNISFTIPRDDMTVAMLIKEGILCVGFYTNKMIHIIEILSNFRYGNYCKIFDF